MERKTILDWAEALLIEFNRPLKAIEIADIVLARGLMGSNAQNPAASLSNTIDKMIHQGKTTRLVHVNVGGRRRVALPKWNTSPQTTPTHASMIQISPTQEQFIKMILATGMATTRDEALQLVFNAGMMALKGEIQAKVDKLLNNQ